MAKTSHQDPLVCFNRFEDELITRFHEHPFFRRFDELSNERFIVVLLQLGHLSLNFVRWYEKAKLGLTSETAKEVLRNIMRDEIPREAPTHQDDRLYDLGLMDVSPERVLEAEASTGTRRTLARLDRLVRYPQPDYELRALITLRIAGEVLVAETYRHVVPALEQRFGIKPEQSRFYWPHFHHDEKGAKTGHTSSFDQLLKWLITDERSLAIAREAARQAFDTRVGFFDQFLGIRQIRRTMDRGIAAVGALVLLGLTGWGVGRLTQGGRARGDWAGFLSASPSETRAFFTACDHRLLRRFQETGARTDLLKIGTMEACREVWGEGP